MRRKFRQDSGQVALVMVLVMTVVSAIAVSVAGRSTVETKIQEINTQNKEAFLTAQAGLEDALSKGQAVTGALENGGQYSVVKSDLGGSSLVIDKVGVGETFEINMEGATGITGLRVYWKRLSGVTEPALFISEVRSGVATDYAFDSSGSYGFTKVVNGGVLAGVNYDYVTPVISVTSGVTKYVRVTVLGGSVFLGVSSIGGSLPTQIVDYKSTASVASGDKVIKYGIEYKESKSNQLPTIFDYSLFSGGTIVQ